MVCQRLTLALILCTAMFLRTGWAQSAGGLVSATTSVRYTPVAFPQLVQLSDFNTVAITLRGSDANGDTLTFALVTGPSLGVVGALDPATGTITYTPPPGFSTNDTFTFSVSDGVLSSETVAVTIFAPRPAASLSATTLDLGNQVNGVKSPAKTVTINNTSVAPLSISTTAINGPNAADFAIENNGTCPKSGSLAAGATCTFALTITPSATGTRTAILTITDNAFDSPQIVALTGTGTDFSFGPTPGASTSATISPGQTAVYNLQINSSNGFSGQVNLGCSGAPALATCTVNPALINVSGIAAAFTVSVKTTAPAAAAAAASSGDGGKVAITQAVGVLAAWLLLIPCFIRKKRVSLRVARTAFASAFLLGMTSCGGGSTTPPTTGQPGTPTGAFTITVNGTSNGATRSTSLSLTVQ